MLNITDTGALARALDSPLDPALKRLLCLRRDQLEADADCDLAELAQFLIIDGNETVPEVEAAAGYPVITSPAFEWVDDHGGWYEAVTILSDDGFGVVLFVPEGAGVDPTLLSVVRSHATPAAPDTTDPDQGQPCTMT